jgi:two-component system sensor histidine kinase KdpD
LTAKANPDSADSLSALERGELLEVINEESDRLNDFVEEMMTLAQLEGGQLLLHRSEMPAQDIINIAVSRAAASLRQRTVTITIPKGLRPLLVDGASMSGVVYELLVNAAKYSSPDSAIRITAQEISGNEIEIAVENAGTALPAAVRQRAFEKFYRGPKQRREKQGFGLGLSIARGIVEAHGGHIRMDVGPGGTGTTVRFTAPCAPAPVPTDEIHKV